MSKKPLSETELEKCRLLIERAILNKQMGFGFHTYDYPPLQEEISNLDVVYSRNLEISCGDNFVEITLEKGEFFNFAKNHA